MREGLKEVKFIIYTIWTNQILHEKMYYNVNKYTESDPYFFLAWCVFLKRYKIQKQKTIAQLTVNKVEE